MDSEELNEDYICPSCQEYLEIEKTAKAEAQTV